MAIIRPAYKTAYFKAKDASGNCLIIIPGIIMDMLIIKVLRRRFLRIIHFCTTENMVFFRPGNLHSLCSPGNQDYPKIIHFEFSSPKKVESDNVKVLLKLVFLLKLVVIINDFHLF